MVDETVRYIACLASAAVFRPVVPKAGGGKVSGGTEGKRDGRGGSKGGIG